MIGIVGFIMPEIQFMAEIRHMADLQYSQGTMDWLDGRQCHLDGLLIDHLLSRTENPRPKEHQMSQIHIQPIQIIAKGILIAV